MTTTDHPKYRALWPPYQSIPYRQGEEPRPTLLKAADHRFDAWAPAPGNATPSWTWVSTPHINSGMFCVPGRMLVRSGRPSEPRAVLHPRGHAPSLQSRHVRRGRAASGGRVEHPRVVASPRLQLRRRRLLHRLVGARRDAHRPLQGEGRERHALRARVVRAQPGRPERRPRPQRGLRVQARPASVVAGWAEDGRRHDEARPLDLAPSDHRRRAAAVVPHVVLLLRRADPRGRDAPAGAARHEAGVRSRSRR